jgi:hypothetical protein
MGIFARRMLRAGVRRSPRRRHNWPTVISSSGSIKQTALEAAHCTNELGYEFTKRYLKFA